MPYLRLAIVLAAFCLSPRPASSQTTAADVTHSMHVEDVRGAPVVGAQVLIGDSATPGLLIRSGSDGYVRAKLVGPDSVDALVRAIGFRPRSIRWAPGDGVRLQLEPIAVSLSAVEVRMVRRCRDDAAARALWNSVVETYGEPAGVRVVGESQTVAATGGREQLDPNDSHFGFRPRFENAAGFELARRRIRAQGWRWLALASIDPAVRSYEYPGLDSEEAMLLTDPVFASTHRFVQIDRRDDFAVVHFCPDDASRGAGLTGSVTVDLRDRSIRHASWHVTSTRGSEAAGGEAGFLSVAGPGGQKFLLPQYGNFWLAESGEVRYQRSAAYRAWRVTPDTR